MMNRNSDQRPKSAIDEVEIKERLLRMRESALRRQEKLARHVEHREEPLPADFSEQAIELENEETMVQLAARMSEEISNVDVALQRLEQGIYNQCAICQGTIEAPRLQALPATTVCIDCAPSGP